MAGLYQYNPNQYSPNWLGQQAYSNDFVVGPDDVLNIHQGVTNQDVLNAGFQPINGLDTTGAGGGSGFGLSGWGSLLGGIGAGIQGLSGLANAYMGLKNYELAQDQFGFQKALANRNIANQAKIINNTYDNAGQVAAGMIGGKDANGRYGFTDPAVVRQYEQRARDRHVDGSPIG